MPDAPETALTDFAFTPQIIREEGAGKAYQSVAQSMAIAIQDATDNLRNINTITTTAIGVALAEGIASGNMATYNDVLTQVNTVLTNATTNFTNLGSAATTIATNFPSGQ